MLTCATNGTLTASLLAWMCTASSNQADISLLQVAGIDVEQLGPACPWLQIGSVHGSGMGYFKLQPGGSQTDAPVDKSGIQVSGLPQTQEAVTHSFLSLTNLAGPSTLRIGCLHARC